MIKENSMSITGSRHRLILLTSSFLALAMTLSAQGKRLTVGPLTVTIPAGWTAKAGFLPGDRERYFSPESTFDQYFYMAFSSPKAIEEDVLTHHNTIIHNLSGLMAPGAKPQSGILGQFLWTRIAIQRPGSKPETVILYSAKAGALYVAIDVDATNEDLVTKNLPAVEAMLSSATLANSPRGTAPSASNSQPPYSPQENAMTSNHSQSGNSAPQAMQPSDAVSSAGGNFTTQAQMPTGPASLSQYVYAVPPTWAAQRHTETVALVSQASSTGEQCIIEMWPMRPATANLIQDAVSGFQQAFNGFEPRNQSSDGMPIQPLLIRGTSGAGWDYVIIKQGVGRHGPYQTLMGSVMAAKLNNSVAIVSTLSKVPLVSSCLGELIADAWPKYFYSLGFKSWVPQDQSDAMKRTLAGTWTSATSTAADQFTFSPNGRYGGASAAQNYNLLASGVVQTTTQAFFGDGAYSLQGNTIAFTPDDRGRPPSAGLLRIEHESKDGGRTWTPVLYLLRISTVDGKEYEVRYKKTG
jgi:hypothetical protein